LKDEKGEAVVSKNRSEAKGVAMANHMVATNLPVPNHTTGPSLAADRNLRLDNEVKVGIVQPFLMPDVEMELNDLSGFAVILKAMEEMHYYSVLSLSKLQFLFQFHCFQVAM
jgi:hypothetical protein